MSKKPWRRPGARHPRRPPHGQHFLADTRVRERILRHLGCRVQDTWLEIGAGHGEMTGLLAASGARVVGVERDPRLAADLRHRFADRPQVHVLEADILQLSLPELAREHSVARWRVYGNLPYYITSPILHWLFEAIGVVADIHVVVQREVAERLAAEPGRRDYGYLSVVTQFHTRPQILAAIPRGAFRPPPQVESALVRLVPPGEQAALGISQPQEFLRFVAACFRQKRRTLRSNLRPAYGAAAVEEALAQMALAPRARAEELSLRALAQFYHRLTPRRGLVVRSEGV